MKQLYMGKKFYIYLYRDFMLSLIDCKTPNIRPPFVGINLGWITITMRQFVLPFTPK